MIESGLYPISVTNRSFTSANVLATLKALGALAPRSMTFLVADALHAYNRGIDHASEDVVSVFSEPNAVVEKRRWMRNVVGRARREGIVRQAEVKGIDEVTDRWTLHTLRNLDVAFVRDPRFRSDVEAVAEDYCRRRTRPGTPCRDLSVRYVLEELAISTKLKFVDRITAEYYMGEVFKCTRRLFAGEYAFRARDLVGQSREVDVRLFSFSWETGRWFPVV